MDKKPWIGSQNRFLLYRFKMIQHGIKLGVLCLWLGFSSCSRQEKSSAGEENKKRLFHQSTYVLVESAFFNDDEYDAATIQKVISHSLREMGKIEETPKDPNQINSLLAITINRIAEDSLQEDVLWKKLPVMQISMILTSPTRIPGDPPQFISGFIWKEERFVDTTQQDLSVKIEKTVEHMLEDLKTQYEKAQVKPVFINHL